MSLSAVVLRIATAVALGAAVAIALVKPLAAQSAQVASASAYVAAVTLLAK